MSVHEAMSTQVVAMTPTEPAAHAADLLIERDITGLPVIDDDGRILGVVTELDLIRAIRVGADLGSLTVSDVMDRRPLFVRPNTHLYTVVALMEEWQVHRLPVCAQGRLVGTVSRGDVLRALAGRGQPVQAAGERADAVGMSREIRELPGAPRAWWRPGMTLERSGAAPHEPDTVALGSRVLATDEAGDMHLFMVVSPSEADEALGYISATSPMGAALLGRCAGERARVSVPVGVATYSILGVG